MVDASVVAVLVFGELRTDEALSPMEGVRFYAPVLLDYEPASVARKNCSAIWNDAESCFRPRRHLLGFLVGDAVRVKAHLADLLNGPAVVLRGHGVVEQELRLPLGGVNLNGQGCSRAEEKPFLPFRSSLIDFCRLHVKPVYQIFAL